MNGNLTRTSAGRKKRSSTTTHSLRLRTLTKTILWQAPSATRRTSIRRFSAREVSRSKPLPRKVIIFDQGFPKGEKPPTKRHAKDKLHSRQTAAVNEYGSPVNVYFEPGKHTDEEKNATLPENANAPTSPVSEVGALNDAYGQATSSKVQIVQLSNGAMAAHLPIEAIYTDPVDSLETHMCDGKLEKSLQDYIYYDTISARPTATGNTTELILSESTVYSATPLVIEGLHFPMPTTPMSKPGTGEQLESSNDKEGIFKNIVAATPMLIVMVIFTVVLLLRHFPFLTQRPSALGTQAAYVCDGNDCASVLDVLLGAADNTTSPCDDFYSHVCGKWSAKTPGRASYAIENRRKFTDRLHHSLTDILRSPSLCAQREYEMARFYDSCHAFIRGRRPPSAIGTLSKAGIDTEAWLKCATLEELMSTVLETCFRTGLSSIVTAFATTSDVGMEPGTTLANSLNDKNGSTVDAFLEWATRERELPNDTQLQLFLRHTDTKLDNIRITFERTYLFKNLSIRELESSFPGFSWTAVFRHAFYNGTMFTSDCFIRVWGLEQVKDIVITLFAERTIHVNVYTLLLALAQLAKYEYILPPSGAHDHDIVVSCLEVTGQYFPTLFAAWVAQVVVPPSSVDYVEDMISVFRLLAPQGSPLYRTK
ncbi:hypothetical protein MRX96_034171 [Rhipicephalus microplus]